MRSSFKGHSLFLAYLSDIKKGSSSEKDIEGFKRRRKFEIENF